MAITPSAGYNGNITLGTGTLVAMPITEWKLSGSCNMIDVTHGKAGGYRCYHAGICRWSGSCSTFVDDTTSQLTLLKTGDTIASLILYYAGSTKYAEFTNTEAGITGIGLVTDISVTSSVDDVIKVTFNFVINGSATISK